jgi:hypothetical protein
MRLVRLMRPNVEQISKLKSFKCAQSVVTLSDGKPNLLKLPGENPKSAKTPNVDEENAKLKNTQIDMKAAGNDEDLRSSGLEARLVLSPLMSTGRNRNYNSVNMTLSSRTLGRQPQRAPWPQVQLQQSPAPPSPRIRTRVKTKSASVSVIETVIAIADVTLLR